MSGTSCSLQRERHWRGRTVWNWLARGWAMGPIGLNVSDMKRLRQPCLILLDAINESAAPPEVLKEALHYLLREAERVDLKVVVTCRTDFWQFYRAAFWASYIWTGTGDGAELARSSARGQDLPLSRLNNSTR